MISARYRRIGRSLSLAVALLVAAPAATMRVQPMTYELTPSGSGTVQDIRVENTDARPMPVEIRVERRHIGETGEDTRTPAEDDFLVFPPQAIVPANSYQNIRVKYIGDPAITETALYVITVAQVPVDTTGLQQSGVKFLFSLGTSVAVTPRDAKFELKVVAAVADVTGKIRVTVTNAGKKFGRLNAGGWTLKSGDRTERIEGDALRGAVPQPLIEPGRTRTILLPVSADFPREAIVASVDAPVATGR